jgi:hypothetical protein
LRAKDRIAANGTLQPDGDHILYRLSLGCGFAEDAGGAYENLKRAIDLEPKNRAMARHDADFRAPAAEFPVLRGLPGPNIATIE